MSQFFNNAFSKYQCGFRTIFNTQLCPLAMLQKPKKSVDSRKAFGALPTDLSKAFDCLDHELLIVKQNTYGFSLPALKPWNYNTNRNSMEENAMLYARLSLQVIYY